MKPPPAPSDRKRRDAAVQEDKNNSTESQQSQTYKRYKRQTETNLCIEERLGDVASVYMAYFLQKTLYHNNKKGFAQAKYDPYKEKNYPYQGGKLSNFYWKGGRGGGDAGG